MSDNYLAFESGIPVLDSIYWGKYKIWTINTIENFQVCDNNKKTIGIDNAFKNDLSVIIGDITFIVDSLELELIYDKSIINSHLPKHKTHGVLNKSFLIIDSQKIEISPIEMAIIDSEINTKVVSENINGSVTTVIEKNMTTHIFKLSTLLIKVLAKYERDTNDETTENLRKIIVEFMKKIKAIHSFQIPVEFTNTSDYLYNEAYNESSVINDYIEQKKKKQFKKGKNKVRN